MKPGEEGREPERGAARWPGSIRWRSLRVGWPGVLYGGLLALILGVGAWQRFRLPQTPLVDNDFRGYLHPALSQLSGGPFQHTNGRHFLYPGFLWAVLKTGGDYRFICIWQHGLGLLTGVLIARAWNVLCDLFPAGERARRWARFFGLGLVADFLWSQSPLLFEHTIRPEAVFPFFLAGSFLLNFGALHARYREPRPRVERWCLGTNLFATAVLQALKPSFGLGLAVANLPLAWWFAQRAVPWRAKAATAGTAGLAAVVLLSLPERILKQHDPEAATFLPTMLFTIHARPIHAQIVEDLRAGQTAPYRAERLREFNDGLERALRAARQPENHPWHILGFNADYLLHDEPVFARFFGRDEEPALAAFCFHYYRRAWLHQTGSMLDKIGQQLGMAYPLHVETWLGKDLRVDIHRKRWLRRFFTQRLPAVYRSGGVQSLALLYQRAWVSMQLPGAQETLPRSPEGMEYLRRMDQLRTTDATTREFFLVHYLNDLSGKTRLLLLLVSAATAVVVSWRAGKQSTPLLAGVGLVFAVNFAMFLTVGIAHSLDIDRYVETQQLCTAWGGFAAVLLVARAAAPFWRVHDSRPA